MHAGGYDNLSGFAEGDLGSYVQGSTLLLGWVRDGGAGRCLRGLAPLQPTECNSWVFLLLLSLMNLPSLIRDIADPDITFDIAGMPGGFQFVCAVPDDEIECR